MEAGFQEKSKSLQQQVLAGLGMSRKSGAGLRMTPMIDVIFLLLAFFIITVKFHEPEAFVPVKLPSPDLTRMPGSRIVEPLILEIKGDPEGCKAKIGAEEEILLLEETPEEGLAAFANTLSHVCIAQQRTSEDPIELICHDEVTWDFVVKIYDVLQAMGASNITFVTTEEGHDQTH